MSDVPVLDEGPGWVAVSKPSGLPVVPPRHDAQAPTLRRVLEAQLGRPVWVVHRLDRDTSGVCVFALDADSHRSLCAAFLSRTARKTYLAVCRRAAPGAATAGRVDLPLLAVRGGGVRTAAPGTPRAKPSVTGYRVVGLRGDLAVVEARPQTGRTHQVRVHLAAAGWPLAVDPRYGDPGPVVAGAARCERLTLHARALEIGDISITAPVPGDLAPMLAAILQKAID